MFKLNHASIAVAAVALAHGAMAEDFSGFYVGGHLGQGSGESEVTAGLGGLWSSESPALRQNVVALLGTELEPEGEVYGLQAGYQHQWENGLVLGAELDYSQLDMDDTRVTGFVPTIPFPSLTYAVGNSVELNEMIGLRFKAGYAFGSHLVYVTAGAVQADADASASLLSNGGYAKRGTASETLDGTQYGIGYAFAVSDHWSLGAEYLLTELDDMDYAMAYLPGSAFPGYSETIGQSLEFDTLRLTVNFRF